MLQLNIGANSAVHDGFTRDMFVNEEKQQDERLNRRIKRMKLDRTMQSVVPGCVTNNLPRIVGKRSYLVRR